ncbi:copper resistance protein NlpE [Gelidibacter pelagius]|uniref:Copper resistance protein NlpE N-terminal domain-containing protein n=1 Tax=Gelidibacter pelagius TaxID=2819985 RepID=A0ABS3SMN4_9FLAO|nr:copper resistance protein NlpE [Gelidibacter pelagius]MBO3096975.1 copper resistance protein NlpE N-terminal domain-containing protein [Gelidibacter pelagius]
MKTTIINSLCIALVLFVTSCNSGKKKETQTIEEPQIEEVDMGVTGDNSMTSLDWNGVYEGEVPCADCEGIKTVVTINSDKTYTIQETYLGKETTPIETKGSFEWDDQGQRILLSNDRNPYFVGENTLTLLDSEGNKNTGDLEALYVLRKVMD